MERSPATESYSNPMSSLGRVAIFRKPSPISYLISAAFIRAESLGSQG